MPASVNAVADVVRDSYRRGKAHALIVVAEGVSGGGDRLASELAAKHADVGFDVRLTRIGHVQRVAAAAIRETPLDQVTGRIKPIESVDVRARPSAPRDEREGSDSPDEAAGAQPTKPTRALGPGCGSYAESSPRVRGPQVPRSSSLRLVASTVTG